MSHPTHSVCCYCARPWAASCGVEQSTRFSSNLWFFQKLRSELARWRRQARMPPHEHGPVWREGREGSACEDTAAGVGDNNGRKRPDASAAMTISVVSAGCGTGSNPTRDQRSDRAEVAQPSAMRRRSAWRRPIRRVCPCCAVEEIPLRAIKSVRGNGDFCGLRSFPTRPLYKRFPPNRELRARLATNRTPAEVATQRANVSLSQRAPTQAECSGSCEIGWLGRTCA